MNKKELLAVFKKDFQASEYQRDTQDAKIARWKSEYNGALYGNEEEGKSKIVSRDIKKQDEWQHSSLLAPFISTPDIVKCQPVTWEDKAAAVQSELLLNTQFTRQFDRYNFMSKALKVLSTEGTVVIQTGWEYRDEEVEVVVDTIMQDEYGNEYIEQIESTETRILVNKPTASIRRNEDIFMDPTCMDDMDNCQFVVVRYESDLSSLKLDGRYKNLDKLTKSGIIDAESEPGYESQTDDTFKFEDDPRKKLLVHEYWGNYDVNGDGIAEAIVCVWVNNTIIRLESNPYPDQKLPFILVPFNSVPFEMFGEANAEMISDNQKVKTAITRGIIDNMAQSTNGQKGIRKGALDSKNRKRFFSGDDFEYKNTAGDFWEGSYNSIPGSAFDMLGMMNNEIESITGIKGFSGGINGDSLGNTATSARGALDATSIRRLNIVKNIAENLVKPLMRKWLSYDSEFLSEEEIIRNTNGEFAEIRKDDLAGEIDIDIQVSTAEDSAAKSQELAFLLQTLGNTMPFEMTQLVMAELARISNMPVLEKSVKEFKQESDPMEEEMKQVQLANAKLENQKLQAEIYQLNASAGEDEADARSKNAKAGLDEAKIRNLNSKTDREDLAFIKEDEEIDEQNKRVELETKHQHDIEKKNLDRQFNLDQMKMQAILGSRNEQIGVAR